MCTWESWKGCVLWRIRKAGTLRPQILEALDLYRRVQTILGKRFVLQPRFCGCLVGKIHDKQAAHPCLAVFRQQSPGKGDTVGHSADVLAVLRAQASPQLGGIGLVAQVERKNHAVCLRFWPAAGRRLWATNSALPAAYSDRIIRTGI